MGNTVTHKFQPTIAEQPGYGSASGGVGPAEWSAEHAFAGGADGQVLVRDSTQTDGARWSGTLTAHGVVLGQGASPLTALAVLAKGSLLVGQTAADPTALTVGTDGQVLQAKSADSHGVAWGLTLPATVATGDLLYGSATAVLSALADVAAGQVLTSRGVGVAPAWSATPTLAGLIGTANQVIGGTFGDQSVILNASGSPIFAVVGTSGARLFLQHSNAPANVKLFETRSLNGLYEVRTINDAATASATLAQIDAAGAFLTVLGSAIWFGNATVPTELHSTNGLTRTSTPAVVVDIPGLTPPSGAASGSAIGGIAVVRGDDGAGNRFVDCIVFSQANVSTLASLVSAGAPAARTYSIAGTQVLLAMASGSYTVYVSVIQI